MYQFQADFEMKMEKMNYQLQKELEGQTVQPTDPVPCVGDSVRMKLTGNRDYGYPRRKLSEVIGSGLAKKNERSSVTESEAISQSI